LQLPREHQLALHNPWEIREQIAIFKESNRNIEEQVYHIKREVNGVAHNYAQQAELIPKNHHITARSSQSNQIFLKSQKSTTFALVASNVH
jgi:predicted phage-related endonuclease